MMTLGKLAIAARMMECRDTMKHLYGDRWPAVSEPYRTLISGAMEATGDKNPLSAVIPICKDMQAKGQNHVLLMAVAVDMADS